MRKSELIQSIALLNPDLSEPVCRTLVGKLFNAIIDHLRDGGAVELRGFGRFFLGSGLVDHSQKMTVAARATAEKKTVGHRS